MEEIINWLHELIAGVHVIKTGEKKAAAKEVAGAATGADTDSSTCYSLSLFRFSREEMPSSRDCRHRLEWRV